MNIDIMQPVFTLSRIQKYQLRLLKMFFDGVKIVLFDQRIFSLAESESSELYQLLNRLKKRGMTFLVLDYTLPKSAEQVDSIVVVMDSCTICQDDIMILPESHQLYLSAPLVGKIKEGLQDNNAVNSRVVLELNSVSTQYLDHVNIKLHAGERAVIFYNSYEAYRELYHVICGDKKPLEGSIYVDGHLSETSVREKRVKEGVSSIESFGSPGYFFENLTVFENYCLPRGLKTKSLWWRPKFRKHVISSIKSILGRDAAALAARDLMPDEIQKLKLYSEIMAHPKVLVCLNPFSSVDRHMRKEAKTLFRRLAGNGTGILVFSSNQTLKELKGLTLYELDKGGKLQTIN